jgi:CRP/FNR family cyclic AMP-dependent transcriptional regulator
VKASANYFAGGILLRFVEFNEAPRSFILAGAVRIAPAVFGKTAMSEKIWYLKRCDLFSRIPPDTLNLLDARCRSRTFGRNRPIYLPADAADSVFLLAKGRIKICHVTPEGKQSILTFVEPGELFGELALLDTADTRDEYAEAVEATTVVMIPGEDVFTLMRKYPEVSLGVTKLIGLRRQRIERRLKNLLFLSNRDRLTHLLLDLIEQYGVDDADGIRLSISLSHQELANIIGSTRETVTVVLGEMQQEKLIQVGRRRILVLEPARLAEAVRRAAPQLPTAAPLGRPMMGVSG